MSNLKRAVITGIGAISCIGNNISEITKSLKLGTSGIRFNESYKELGMRSHISGSINLNLKDLIDRKHLRFMGEAASYAYLSTAEAIKDSGLDLSRFSSQDVGVIAGSGGASSRSQVEAADIVKSKGVKRIGPSRADPIQCALVEHAEEIEKFTPLMPKKVARAAETVFPIV